MSLKCVKTVQIFFRNKMKISQCTNYLEDLSTSLLKIRKIRYSFLIWLSYENVYFLLKSSTTKYSPLLNPVYTQVSLNFVIQYSLFGIEKYKYTSRINILMLVNFQTSGSPKWLPQNRGSNLFKTLIYYF